MYKVRTDKIAGRPMNAASHLIDPESLHECLDQSGWRIIDCRFDLADPAAGEQLYLGGHIPGAVFADLDRDLASPVGPRTGRHPLPDAGTFQERLGALGVDNTTRIVVYDANNGALAARAWWLLRWTGHSKVQLLDGGLDAWLRQGYDLRGGPEAVARKHFAARPRPELVLTTRELARDPAAIAAMRLIDARDAERFRGELEPIDPIAGHIPGSINLPLTESLNDDGTWKMRRSLEALWGKVLGPDKSQAWAVMCGSGVTACHLALSGLLAGYAEPRVYVGSWSEWIRDPARPIARGAG